MKWDASESSDPDSKLQQVDLRMLEMERGICSVIRAKQSSLCSLSVWDAARDKSSCNNAVQPDEVIHRHAHNAAQLILCNNTIRIV